MPSKVFVRQMDVGQATRDGDVQSGRRLEKRLLAETVRFELTDGVNRRQFSRLLP
jgi:hypothetical protein